MDFVSNFAVPIICRSKEIHQELIKKCSGEVEIRPIVGGDLTRQPFFNKYIDDKLMRENSNAKLIHEQGIYFPNNPHLTKKDVQVILEVFS